MLVKGYFDSLFTFLLAFVDGEGIHYSPVRELMLAMQHDHCKLFGDPIHNTLWGVQERDLTQ